MQTMKNTNIINVNIWDDYYEDGYVPEGEVQTTHMYVEESLDNVSLDNTHKYLFQIMTYINKHSLVPSNVEMKLILHDPHKLYPNLAEKTGMKFDKQWRLIFTHLTHKNREDLVEKLTGVSILGLDYSIYSES